MGSVLRVLTADSPAIVLGNLFLFLPESGFRLTSLGSAEGSGQEWLQFTGSGILQLSPSQAESSAKYSSSERVRIRASSGPDAAAMAAPPTMVMTQIQPPS